MRKKRKEDILELLKGKNYDVIDDDADYKYLLKMPMDSVSEENADRLLKDRDGKEKELVVIQSTSIENMWLNELDELKQYLDTTPKATKVKKQNKK